VALVEGGCVSVSVVGDWVTVCVGGVVGAAFVFEGGADVGAWVRTVDVAVT